MAGEAATTLGSVPLDFCPRTLEDWKYAIQDPMWRICSGFLYKIITKENDNDAGLKVPFKPNRAQKRLLKKMWHRNIILKARQLGFTTLLTIVFLDACLFGDDNTRAAIICHTENAANKIFRDKVRFAYDNLPDPIRSLFPLKQDRADELVFAHNNSSIQVAVSARSGTLQYLHISEFGKICAKFPQRAQEVVTGSIPAVPTNGFVFIESTAEGASGYFYKMTKRSEELHNLKKKLTNKEYRFHFYPWWDNEDYQMPADGVIITEVDHKYFAEIESKTGTTLSLEQRAWWISTRDNDFSGEDAMMWQEYPSYPDEAFKQSNEGAYYRNQMVAMRKQQRITAVPYIDGYPVYTFWDIGNGDGTAVWLMQQTATQFRFIKHLEGWGEPYAFYVRQLQEYAAEKNLIWGTHFLPHDGAHERQGKDNNHSPREMLEQLGLRNVEVVPRINELQYGIQATRDILGQCWIDETECKAGITHLDLYHKKWVESSQSWSDVPEKADGHSESADAFRQFAQALGNGMIGRRTSEIKRRGSHRTV